MLHWTKYEMICEGGYMIGKTRDGSSFYGKKHIYFCSHQDDREYYLKEISEDIFYLINCVIWHDDGEEISESGRQFFYENMDLVVIPVTDKFLNDDNYAARYEVDVFKKANVPILPIITDESQFNAANVLFENRQVLEHTVNDKTKLGYFNKLERFLRGYLLGQSLFKEYGNVFTRTAFISYRKKDRSLILKMLSLIHSNPDLRSLGVWYDEFLTPTEVFTKEIKESIANSSFVLMLITPNTLEKGNYIITDEYPQAGEYHKQIIGILSNTSEADARQYFPDIDIFLELDDTDLPLKIQNAMGIEPVNSTDHTIYYRLGLCYLSGINVERNSDYAIDFMTIASDMGNVDAAAILSSIYAQGIGVEQDSAKEIEWARKYVENAIRSEDSKKIVDSMILLCDSYDKQDLIEESNQVYQELQKYIDTRNEKKDVLEDSALAGLHYGIKLIRRGLWHQAKDTFTRVLSQYKELSVYDAEKYAEGSYELIQLKYNLATALFKSGDNEEAKDFFEDVVYGLEPYVQKDPEGYNDIYIKAIVNLALVYRNIGIMKNDHKFIRDAEQLLVRSVEIADNMLLTKRAVYEPLYASSCQILANFYMNFSMFDESAEYYAKAIDAYINVIKFKEANCNVEFAQTCNNYSVLLRHNGEYSKALEYALYGGKEIKELWLKAPAVYDLIYAKALTSIAIIFTQMEEYDKATKHFMSAIDLYKISSRNSLDRYEGTAECYMECGVMFAKTNQHENAVNCLEFALKHYEILKRNNCGNYDLQIEYIDKWLKGAKND